MFDIGIFAPFGADHERNIAYCRDAGADRHIVLNTGNVSSDDATRGRRHSKTLD